jgi:hypothetical protein
MRYDYVPILVLTLTGALVACGGGGGGGTTAVRPFTSWSAVQPNSKVKVNGMSQSADVSFTVAPNGDVTVTSISPFSSVDTSASSATLTFGASRELTGLSISTPAGTVSWDKTVLGGGTIDCGSGVCLASKASGTSEGIVMDPYSLGWNYQTFGVWETGTTVSGNVGALSIGAPTPVGGLPSGVIATYNGLTAGLYADSAGQLFGTAASMSATVDFTARSVAFATSGTTVATPSGSPTLNADLNLAGTLTYASGTTQFAGPVTTSHANSSDRLNGTATGRFYGPAAEEIGGVYSLSGSGLNSMLGGFGGKR